MPVGTENESYNEFGTGKSDDHQLVIFKIAGEEFGVDIKEVKEIIRWTDVTRIPNTETFIKGVINLRGSIVVVNDLAMKMGLPSKEIDDDTRILVVEVGSNTVGMIVDSATEVLRLDGDKVKDAPSMITSGIDNNFIDGVGVLSEDRLLTLLDLSKVLGSDFDHVIAVQQSVDQSSVKEATFHMEQSIPETSDKDTVNEDNSQAEITPEIQTPSEKSEYDAPLTSDDKIKEKNVKKKTKKKTKTKKK